MNDHAPAQIGHNGGPPLTPFRVHMGEKFIPLLDAYRHKALFGGRGGAKSHACATAITILSARDTKRVVCARQFQNSIRDSVKELIEQKIKSIGLSDQFAIYEREIVHKANESRFTFIGLDRNPESAKSLEGADICWVEEARTINSRSIEILIPTIRKPHSEIWWTWNPEQQDDPVDHYFRSEFPPWNSYIQRVSYLDNPWFYQTEMPNEMLHMEAGNKKRHAHIWLGDYDNDVEGRVFTNITIDRVEVPDHIAPRYGMDFGFGSDPSSIVKCYVNEASKEIYIARESGGRVPLRELPDLMRAVVDDDSDLIKADSSQPGTIDFLNTEGFNLVGAKKGPGSVKTGITWLQGFKLVIDPECEATRDEARLYSWQRDKLTGKRLNVPVDAHNHYFDAIRYATEDCQTIGSSDEAGVILFSFGKPRT